MKIILIGAEGRMGKAIVSLSYASEITQIGSPNSSLPNNITPFLESHDLVLDLSTNEALSKNLPKVLLARKPIVIGITGLTKENLDLIHLAAKTIPVFLSPNFSIGIALLKKLLKQLPEGSYEMTEIHHMQKKDSPSGTALDLANCLPSYPKITSIREGAVIGVHKIELLFEHEKITLTHEVSDRKAFAKGALMAATFLSNKPAGLYTSIYD